MRFSFFLDLLLLILKDIKYRKFTSFLTFFAISFGILSIFFIIIFGTSFSNSLEKELESFGSNNLFVEAKGQSNEKLLDEDFEKFILLNPKIEDTIPFSYTTSSVSKSPSSNGISGIYVVGIRFDVKDFEAFGLRVEKGGKPNLNDNYFAILSSDFSKENFDDKLKVNSNLYIKDNKFKIKGILEEVGNSQDDTKTIYIPMEIYEKIFEIKYFDTIIAKSTSSGDDLEEVKNNLQNKIDNKYGEDTFEVSTLKQLLEQFTAILDITYLVFFGIGFISLIVGALGIVNIMYVIISGKTKEIGVMKAIGATNFQILLLFILYSGFYGFIGAFFGLVLGTGIIYLLSDIGKYLGMGFLELKIDPIYFLYLLGFGTFIGLISGYLPSKKASKLLIVDSFKKL